MPIALLRNHRPAPRLPLPRQATRCAPAAARDDRTRPRSRPPPEPSDAPRSAPLPDRQSPANPAIAPSSSSASGNTTGPQRHGSARAQVQIPRSAKPAAIPASGRPPNLQKLLWRAHARAVAADQQSAIERPRIPRHWAASDRCNPENAASRSLFHAERRRRCS